MLEAPKGVFHIVVTEAQIEEIAKKKMKVQPTSGQTSSEDPVIGGIRAKLRNDPWLLYEYLVGLHRLVTAYTAKYQLVETPAMWQEIRAMAPPANLP